MRDGNAPVEVTKIKTDLKKLEGYSLPNLSQG